MARKLTKWFHADMKPTRIGVYETKDGGMEGTGFQYWDGKSWQFWGYSAEDAFLCRNKGKSIFQNVQWRGLASDPEKSA
jgi:hypothetical protein